MNDADPRPLPTPGQRVSGIDFPAAYTPPAQ